MRVLLSLVPSDEESLQQARRALPYDRLVLITHDPDQAHVRAAVAHERAGTQRPEKHPRVVVVDPDDVAGALDVFEGLLREHRRDTVHFNVAGNPPTLVHAAMVTCLRHGVAASYHLHGRRQDLPILRGLRVEQRFTPAEASMLLALEKGMPVSRLVGSGPDRAANERTLHRLRNFSCLRLSGDSRGAVAELTREGQYYRRQLRALASTRTSPQGILQERVKRQAKRGVASKVLQPLSWPQ